ncbi:MAG: glycosyl hydrolase family 18 protein [Niameybacter sp.]|uniref:glycosyl hydrolase family 18 protein n=1 Tax=Niameybacter sp. TaxID=2033640 RepID=UPI002FC6DDA6
MKIKLCFKTVLSCVLLSLCLSMPAYTQAASTPMTTEAFMKVLKPLDPFNRLDVQSVSGAPLTREKAAAILVKLMGYEGIAKDYQTSSIFSDVKGYNGEISIVKQLEIMNGVNENTFNPRGTVTKEQGETIAKRVEEKLKAPTQWKHAFYALSSSSQMEMIPLYDAVSFGWAQVVYDEGTQQFKLESNNNQNDFKVPQGFEKPMDLAKVNQVEQYLMIFFEDSGQEAQKLLRDEKQREALIADMVSLCNQISKDGQTRSFDGITIDFENFISSDLKAPYVQFLKELDRALEINNKKLNVALQPTNHFKGYDYKVIGEVADRIILMAHDYAPKKLSPFEQEIGVIMTPMTPINEIYKAFCAITHPITGVQDTNKIVLQISYGSTQWQVQDGKVLNAKPYTPTYDKIYERLKISDTQAIYDEQYQNPYAVYEQNDVKNIIWYENNKSVQAKIDLAKLFGIQGVSYWRLGTIPQYE